MINRNGVHLPDTTYGGNPIDWNCSSDSDDSPQRLKAENAKLRELVWDMYVAMWGVSEIWAENICADRMSELGVEVDV